MVKSMPESVKWTEIHGLIATPGDENTPYKVKLGGDEVMILLGIHYWWHGTLTAAANAVHMGLWRKTDSDPPTNVYADGDSPDMVWSEEYVSEFVTESLVASKARDITFPRPIVLVRAPRAIFSMAALANVYYSMRLYYLLSEVSDVDLAKLMVKDHA